MEILFTPHACPIEEIRDALTRLYAVSADCTVQLIKYSENLTYLIEEPDHRKYILRLNRPGYHTADELSGELIWMHRLSIDTDIRMDSVIESSGGNLTECISFSTGIECCCSVFRYLKGISLGQLRPHGKILCDYMEQIGSIAARLHRHVCEWPESDSLKRDSWDWPDLFGENARWGDWSSLTLLTDRQRAILTQAVDIIGKRIAAYGKCRENYGLIHSDFNINNFLVDGNTVQIIDFDDCGYGWFLYDLGYCVMTYEGAELEQVIQAWLRGYTRFRQLRPEDFAEIETFILLKKIHRFSWIAQHSDSDTAHAIPSSYYSCTVRHARNYIKKYS